MPFTKLLLQAAAAGDLGKINEMLDAGAYINAYDDSGDTALWLAIRNAHKPAVILLYDRGVDLTFAPLLDFGTCLTYAALYVADKTIVDMLLQTKKVGFESPSHEFAFRGNLEELQRTSHKVPCKDSCHNNELHYAASNGQLGIIVWLIQQGFSMTEKNQSGVTPLLVAAFNGHLSVVQWLLKHGASLQEEAKDGYTALLCAAYNGHLSVVQWLLQNGASLQEKAKGGDTALLTAACNGHLPLVQWLLQHGASLQEKTDDGKSALLYAACNGHLPLVQWLLKQTTLIFEKTKNGETALFYALEKNHPLIIYELIKAGAAIGQSLYSPLPIKEGFMDGQVVIGLKINGDRVTRKTPGYENAITMLKELNATSDKITHHFELIKACHEYLQTNVDKDIELLQKKLMLLSDNGLKYRALMFIANNKELRKEWKDTVENSKSLSELNDMMRQLTR